jgi:hypothetical protein
MEYASVFCGTNLLSLDEIQVNGEGDGSTEMMLFSDICSDHDGSEVVIEANSDHSLGGRGNKKLLKCIKANLNYTCIEEHQINILAIT